MPLMLFIDDRSFQIVSFWLKLFRHRQQQTSCNYDRRCGSVPHEAPAGKFIEVQQGDAPSTQPKEQNMTSALKHLSQFIVAAAMAVGGTSVAIADNDENPYTGYWHREMNHDVSVAKSAPIAPAAHHDEVRPSGAFWDNEGAEDWTAFPQQATRKNAGGVTVVQRSPFSDYTGD